MPSENSGKEVTYEDTLLTKNKQESSSGYDGETADQSRYDNEEVPAEIVTPKQKSNSFEPIFPEGGYGKKSEDTAVTNTDRYVNLNSR